MLLQRSCHSPQLLEQSLESLKMRRIEWERLMQTRALNLEPRRLVQLRPLRQSLQQPQGRLPRLTL